MEKKIKGTDQHENLIPDLNYVRLIKVNHHLFLILLFLKQVKKSLVCQPCMSKKLKIETTVGTSNNKYLIPKGKMEVYKFRK